MTALGCMCDAVGVAGGVVGVVLCEVYGVFGRCAEFGVRCGVRWCMWVGRRVGLGCGVVRVGCGCGMLA